MSLATISGKVSSLNVGASIGRAANSAIMGESSFLRNKESTQEKILGGLSTVANAVTDIFSLAGVRSSMYKIGEIPEQSSEDYGDSWVGKTIKNLANKAVTAVSYWTGKGNGQQGVIIDGFDNFKGDISVALAEQPVMYGTAVTDNVVRNPNRLTMRVYVDLVHSDDIVQDLFQQIKDGLGGLVGDFIGVGTGDTMNRAQKALSNLQWIQEYGKPFKVYTPHKVYENMMIESISPINDQKTNEILVADITFKEIIYYKPLAYANKNVARMVPAKAQSTLAKVLGWF